jgi:chorismate mutase
MTMTTSTYDHPDMRLADCRTRIDRIDAALVALLRERMRTALEAGSAKTALGQPLLSPAREAEVLERVAQLASGPLEPEAVMRVFDVVVTETRRVQERAQTPSSPHAAAWS